MDNLGAEARPGNARTEIIFKDSGTLEIYHIRRQATDRDEGGKGIEVGLSRFICTCRTSSELY